MPANAKYSMAADDEPDGTTPPPTGTESYFYGTNGLVAKPTKSGEEITLSGDHLARSKTPDPPRKDGLQERAENPLSHRRMDWADRSEDDYANMDVLRGAQQQWTNNHPDPKMMLPRTFPTTRREALKVSFRQIDKFERLLEPPYMAAIARVLGSFPDSVRRTLNFLFLNYLAPNTKLIQQQGRHLFVMKCYRAREESICWFIPLAEVTNMHAAAAESLRQGISYNDLALTQTYSVNSVLAVHAETWEPRGAASHNNYGDCTWIGGMAFHYAMGDEALREESVAFANVSTAKMPELAAKIARNKEKKARQKANRKARAAEEGERKKEVDDAAAAVAETSRRAGLVQVHSSLAEALAKGTLAR